MTTTHAGLALYREQLRDAIARDLTRGPFSRRRVRAMAVAVPAAVAAAAVTVMLLTPGTAAGPSAADAAVIRHVEVAMTAPAGSIIYQRAMVSLRGGRPRLYELWQDTRPPFTYRVIKWGHEGTGRAWHGAPSDPAGLLRSMIHADLATVAATTTINGVAALRLDVSGAPDRWVNGVAYVARSDYHPLVIISHGETIRYQAYEYLPRTARNLRLLHAR
jgi:hypothetical protein